MESCKICNQKFKLLKGLITHVNVKHFLNTKEYYDNHIKKNGEGECEVCGKPTKYRNAGIGYLKNCSIECRNKNKNIKRDFLVGKKQTKEQILKRVNNTNQSQKEKNRKETMLKKYGVDNPTKLEHVTLIISKKNTGKVKVRNHQWQKKIIDSKRVNGTLKHSEETKNKIKSGVNKFLSENFDREKYISKNQSNHISGWYNNLFFRSSLELSFLINNLEKKLVSCENENYKVIYDINGKKRAYYPDYTDGEFIYEIKPINLLNSFNNDLKIKEAFKTYGEKYKVITEVESPYVNKKIILELISNREILLTKNSEKKMNNYKF